MIQLMSSLSSSSLLPMIHQMTSRKNFSSDHLGEISQPVGGQISPASQLTKRSLRDNPSHLSLFRQAHIIQLRLHRRPFLRHHPSSSQEIIRMPQRRRWEDSQPVISSSSSQPPRLTPMMMLLPSLSRSSSLVSSHQPLLTSKRQQAQLFSPASRYLLKLSLKSLPLSFR